MALTRAGIKTAIVAALQNAGTDPEVKGEIRNIAERVDVRDAFDLSTPEERITAAEAFLASDPATWSKGDVSEAIRHIMEQIEEIPQS